MEKIYNQIIHKSIKERTILKERAELLKLNVKKEEFIGDKLEMLEFILTNERYIIDSTFVTEVIPLKDLTPLPCTPEFILGIINISSRILAVIDIKKFLNLPRKTTTNLNRVILLKYQDIELGILVDEIIGTTITYTNKLQTPIYKLKGIKNDYIEGITKKRLILLNIKKFLIDDVIIINSKV